MGVISGQTQVTTHNYMAIYAKGSQLNFVLNTIVMYVNHRGGETYIVHRERILIALVSTCRKSCTVYQS